jgi:solute carrier family 34 (sodium-dependent phosphate cotransporter)
MRKFLYHLILFLISLASFVLALVLMKEGAVPLAPIFRNKFSVDSPASALGFGWLASSLMLSGSPVAATSLSLLDAGVINPIETFAMISGSRLGAAFIVLLIGFIYMLQGKERDISLGVGLTSLLVTQTIYPAILVGGFFLLSKGWLNHWQYTSHSDLNSFMDVFVTPVIVLLKSFLPTGVLFPIGFLMMVGSLWLFDHAIPQLNLQKTDLGMINHLLYRPTVTFLLGAAITSMTMSVSVSLSLLVPLSVRGFVRRENIIPYIMGANITTFVDTLVAAALLSNPEAVTVVFVQMISVLFVCLIIFLTSYRFYVRTIERIVRTIGKSRFNLFVYLLLIFGIPFILLWIG